jgi:hypothetical protein
MSEIPIEINHIPGLLVNVLLVMAINFDRRTSQNPGLLQGNSIPRKQYQNFSIFTRSDFGFFALRVGLSHLHLFDCQEQDLPGRNS